MCPTYFIVDHLTEFDAQKGEDLVNWKRYRMTPRQAFNTNIQQTQKLQMLGFPQIYFSPTRSLSFTA